MARLLCGHVLSFETPVKMGEVLFCRTCCAEHEVISNHAEWQARCTRCRYSRSYGAAEITARTKAAKHSATRHHPVKIIHDGQLITTVGEEQQSGTFPSVGQLILDLETDPPPF